MQRTAANLYIAMLNVELCTQCDAFVLQRASNFAHLIDKLRLMRGKGAAPFVEIGDYTFGW